MYVCSFINFADSCHFLQGWVDYLESTRGTSR